MVAEAKTDEDLQQFVKDLSQEVSTEASLFDEGMMLAEAFTQLVINDLNESGDWPEGHVCYHKQRGAEVSGWGWDAESGQLDLCVTEHLGSGTLERLGKAEADSAINRLSSFFELSTRGLHEQLEDASPQFDLAWHIHDIKDEISAIRLFLFTDQLTNAKSRVLDGPIAGVPASIQIWDIERLQRFISSGEERDQVEIDFHERYGFGLQCIEAPNADPELASYLAVIPGSVLADLYNHYGSRLLERNVRSFLQARGKVNRGIRDTILNEPERFFSYNNGISATASAVDIKLNNGVLEIGRFSDLQIVNGGQTTASLATVAKRNKNLDLSELNVQMKLTVVPESRIDEIVPLISRYANSQNSINEADLTSNHDFHVAIEELSRTIWAPAPQGGTRETRWFYERARGQYNELVASGGHTPARRKAIKEAHPTRQKFTKTDLTKFEMTWRKRPDLVSRGAQKCFVEFMLDLDKAPIQPDQQYFEDLCAKALLFKSAETIVSREKFGGYRANIVAYTISLINDYTDSKIDLGRIWRNQEIGELTAEAIRAVSHQAFDHLANNSGGRNVTEWAKREECWNDFRRKQPRMPDLKKDLGASRKSSGAARSKSAAPAPKMIDQMSPSELKAWSQTVDAHTWMDIATWSRDTGHLNAYQKRLAVGIGRVVQEGGVLSDRQILQGRRLFDEARELGYTSA